MPREVEWADDSERDLRRLDQRTRERIRQAVYRLADDGYGDVKRLQGRPDEWRLRVGNWRVMFTLDDDPALLGFSSFGFFPVVGRTARDARTPRCPGGRPRN